MRAWFLQNKKQNKKTSVLSDSRHIEGISLNFKIADLVAEQPTKGQGSPRKKNYVFTDFTVHKNCES